MDLINFLVNFLQLIGFSISFRLLYISSAILIFLIAVLITFWRTRDIYERQMVLCFVVMFILPFFGTELFVVPLFLWIFNQFIEKDESINLSEDRNISTNHPFVTIEDDAQSTE